MKFSFFSLPVEIKNLVVIGVGNLPNTPKGYLLTDRGRIVTWRFYFEGFSLRENHGLSVQEFFDQFRVLMIILCHGGKFAAGIFEGNRPLVHKTISRYVVRKKQGMKQSKKNSTGKRSLSAGAKFRSEQERKFMLDVIEWLSRHQELIQAVDVIAYHAPGRNRNILFHGKSIIDDANKIVTTIPFATKAVNYEEVQRCLRVLTNMEFIEVEDDDFD